MDKEVKDRFRLIYVFLMGAIVAFGVTDIVLDVLEVIDIWHKLIEVALMLFALISGSYIWFAYRQKEVVLAEARTTIGHQMRELAEWKNRHSHAVREMNSAIQEQFAQWGLSKSEAQVATLLIRGYSHKQISGHLDKSERTVRNQSLSIYRKTGMAGRNELVAYFMEIIFQLDDLEVEGTERDG